MTVYAVFESSAAPRLEVVVFFLFGLVVLILGMHPLYILSERIEVIDEVADEAAVPLGSRRGLD